VASLSRRLVGLIQCRDTRTPDPGDRNVAEALANWIPALGTNAIVAAQEDTTSQKDRDSCEGPTQPQRSRFASAGYLPASSATGFSSHAHVDHAKLNLVSQEFGYEAMRCRTCGALLQPDLSLGGRTASSYARCVYRCKSCRVGYSNARGPEQRRALYEHPSGNVPAELADGLERTLRGAFNRRARGSKWARFGSSNSEDAVTWSVFRYLEQTGQLDRLAAAAGAGTLARGDASLLLWGHPVSGPIAPQLSAQLACVCDALGERVDRRSEPDVIVAWPELLVVAEAKTTSPNEILAGERRSKLDRYTVGRPDILAVSPKQVRDAGYYELIRNWRIAADLSDRAGILQWVLVNLGPDRLAKDVAVLRELLADGHDRLKHVRWSQLLSGLDPPRWFADYVSSRRLMQM
jgi:hypothetical protein